MSEMTKAWFDYFETCPAQPAPFPQVLEKTQQLIADIRTLNPSNLDTPLGRLAMLGFIFIYGHSDWSRLISDRDRRLVFDVITRMQNAYNANKATAPGMAAIVGELRRQGVM